MRGHDPTPHPKHHLLTGAVAILLVFIVTLSGMPFDYPYLQETRSIPETTAPETHAVSGQVVDANGEPVANATVTAVDLDGQDGFAETTTDDQGHYRLDLRPNATWLMSGRAGDRLTYRHVGALDGDRTVDLHLPDGGDG